MDKDVIERCAKRIEAYEISLHAQRHIGLPGPIEALAIVAQKVRELAVPAEDTVDLQDVAKSVLGIQP